MKKHHLHIKEGVTTRHLIKGILAGLVGGALFLKGNVYAAFVVWYFAISLMLSVEGVIIDFSKRSIKRYTHFGFFKYGKWLQLKAYDSVGISLYKATHTRMSRTNTNTSVTKSYELFLETSGGAHEEILEHPDYEKIVSLGNELSKGLNLPLLNHYQEQVNAAKRKPRRR